MADLTKPSNTSEDYLMLQTIDSPEMTVLLDLLSTVRSTIDKTNVIDNTSSISNIDLSKVEFGISESRGTYTLSITATLTDTIKGTTSTKVGTLTLR
jgi:hypothetical protein